MNTRNLAVEANPPEVTKQKLINDFKVVVADAEALLKATAGQSGEALAAMRAKVGESLTVAKAKMIEAEEALIVKTKAVATATTEPFAGALSPAPALTEISSARGDGAAASRPHSRRSRGYFSFAEISSHAPLVFHLHYFSRHAHQLFFGDQP